MKANKMASWWDRFLDHIFSDPGSCLACGEKPLFRYGFCADCVQRMDFIRWHGQLEPDPDGGRDFPAYALAFYNNFLREIYARYKFEGRSYYRNSFAEMMIDFIGETEELASCSWISYIPMTPYKEFLRGYNPIKEIAATIATRRDMALVHTLEKSRVTKEQNKLGLIQRESNVRGSFRPALKEGRLELVYPDRQAEKIKRIPPESLSSQRGILLDDFITSGNTMKEAAGVLDKLGLSPLCLSLALASYPQDIRSDQALSPSSG